MGGAVRSAAPYAAEDGVQQTEVRWTATTPPTLLHRCAASRPIPLHVNFIRNGQFANESRAKRTRVSVNDPPSPPKKCAALNAEGQELHPRKSFSSAGS